MIPLRVRILVGLVSLFGYLLGYRVVTITGDEGEGSANGERVAKKADA